MSEVNLSLLYYDKGYLSLVLALPVFKIQIIQIMLALLFDKKSEKNMLVLSNNVKNYASTIDLSLYSQASSCLDEAT